MIKMIVAKLPQEEYWHALVPKNTILCSGAKTMTIEKVGDAMFIAGNGYTIDGMGNVTCPECLKKLAEPTDKQFQGSGIVL